MVRRAGEGGIIPAYAGSTTISAGRVWTDTDHPRIRGEHAPRRREIQRGWRIIPAYAGSTIRAVAPGTVGQDHPRIRGEHVEPSEMLTAQNGSSPHTRGARQRRARRRRQPRIIPAYAGSTTLEVPQMTAHRDHPRIRGEHLNSGAAHRVAQGSSPHTRGAHDSRIGALGCRSDHPRIRGEHHLDGGD